MPLFRPHGGQLTWLICFFIFAVMLLLHVLQKANMNWAPTLILGDICILVFAHSDLSFVSAWVDKSVLWRDLCGHEASQYASSCGHCCILALVLRPLKSGTLPCHPRWSRHIQFLQELCLKSKTYLIIPDCWICCYNYEKPVCVQEAYLHAPNRGDCRT